MGRPKEYNKEELLKNAMQLFWKKGFADASLSDLEKATGVNKSGLYSEFSGKDELFVASLDHYIQNAGAYEILQQEPLGAKNIEKFLKLGKECANPRGCFVINSARETGVIPDEAGKLIAAHTQKTKDLLVKNIKASKYKGNASVAADLLFIFNAGICVDQNNAKATSPIKKIEEFLSLFNF